MNPRAPLNQLIALLAFAFAGAAHASSDLPRQNPVPGGIAIVPLALDSEVPPIARFGDQRVLVTRGAGGWLAVIGIPLDVQGSHHSLKIQTAEANTEGFFDVATKDYPVQYVTLRTNKHVELDPEQLARFEREREVFVRAFSAWNEERVPDFVFDPPVHGRLTGVFGSRRYFNEQPRQPHRGIDIAALEGTPVRMPAPGVVLETGNFFFNGNTVLIDHGQGLVTMYCHLKKIDVAPGQSLARGKKIGEVGKTGRATGPHLHWTISLNNAAVDPLLFVDAGAFAQKKRAARHTR